MWSDTPIIAVVNGQNRRLLPIPIPPSRGPTKDLMANSAKKSINEMQGSPSSGQQSKTPPLSSSLLAHLSPMVSPSSASSPSLSTRESKRTWMGIELVRRLPQKERFLSCLCMTWNVNGGAPPASTDFASMLPQTNADIMVLGLQEVDYIRADTVLYDNEDRNAKWTQCIREAVLELNPFLTIVCVKVLVGIQMIVLLRTDLLPFVNSIQAGTVSTGILNVLGNKGAVQVKLTIYGRPFLFVCAHMAAHAEQVARRNQEFAIITANRPHFAVPVKSTEWLYTGISYTRYHDLIAMMPEKEEGVIWIGDFNYRCIANTMVYDRQLDQLALEQNAGRTFAGFREHPIAFPPSYKYEVGTNAISPTRVPSWCDRILWKGDGVEAEVYESLHSNLSDHKPVMALLALTMHVLDPIDLDKAFQSILKDLDAYENESLPTTELSPNVINLGDEVVFRRLVEARTTVTNTGKGVVQFRVTRVPDWVRVSPRQGFMPPQSSTEIALYVIIDRHIDLIDEVLIVHVEGGKDHFVNVKGSLRPTDFGKPLASLCQPRDDSLMEEGENGRPVVPNVLWRLVDYLLEKGCRAEGLFIVPADRVLLSLIHDALDKNELFDRVLPLEVSDEAVILAMAQTILRFLTSLPKSLIPLECQPALLDAASSKTAAAKAILSLPEPNYLVFIYLCKFLREKVLVANAELKAEDLATVFAPTIFTGNTVNVEEGVRKIRRQVAFLMQFLS